MQMYLFHTCITTIDVVMVMANVKTIRTERHLNHAVRLSGLYTGINYHKYLALLYFSLLKFQAWSVSYTRDYFQYSTGNVASSTYLQVCTPCHHSSSCSTSGQRHSGCPLNTQTQCIWDQRHLEVHKPRPRSSGEGP